MAVEPTRIAIRTSNMPALLRTLIVVDSKNEGEVRRFFAKNRSDEKPHAEIGGILRHNSETIPVRSSAGI